MKISSNERRGLRHRPHDRAGKGVEHSADDKQIGWKFEFFFFSFYDPKMEGTLESIVSDMYNPYRCKIDTEAPLGGWRRLFALYTIPSSMYTMFKVTTGRAVPNQDVMISFHRISMESSIPDDADIHGRTVHFVPEHSFYAFDRPFPNTKKYMVHERKDLFGATRLSIIKAHRSNVVDEEEEYCIHWEEIYHFYAWDVPVRGTTKYYVQVCDRPHRYQIVTTMAERPWRPLLTFYAYGAPNGFAELLHQKQPIRKGVMGGTAKAAYRERKKAQDLANRVDREHKLMKRLRKEARAGRRSNIKWKK